MKGVLIFAVLTGVIIGYMGILLIVDGIRTWITDRYNRKQRQLNREQEERQ